MACELGCLSYEEVAAELGISPRLAETRHRLAWRDIDRFRAQWQAKQRFRGHPTTAVILAWLVNSGAINAVGRGAGRFLGPTLLGVIVVVVGILASAATPRAEVAARGQAGVVTGIGALVSSATDQQSIRRRGDQEK